MYLPCKINKLCAFCKYFFGIVCNKSCSIIAKLLLFVKFNLIDTLETWVSTAIVSSLKRVFNITLAVFIPTPLYDKSIFLSFFISPLY